MKVVAFNGSPKKEGNTYQALRMVTDELEKEGIQVEIIHVGDKAIRGCMACNSCVKNRNERCIVEDEVNEWIQKMKEADGIIFGSPTHYASITGTMKSFMDRAFYVSSNNRGLFRHKVGAALAVVRRAGGMAAYEQLNKYINYAEMFVPTANYWNVIYGTVPGQVAEDEEGKQILRILGANMAWLMRIIESGKANIEKPGSEKKVFTNFIR